MDPNKIDKNGWTNIHHAVVSGNEYLIRESIKNSDIDYVNKINNDGNTALHLACKKGNYRLVRVILFTCEMKKIDININQLNNENKTAYDYVVDMGGWDAEVIREELEKMGALQGKDIVKPVNFDNYSIDDYISNVGWWEV